MPPPEERFLERETPRRPRPTWDDEAFEDDITDPEPRVSVHDELTRTVYMVPDAMWRFQARDREDHPGVCLSCDLPCSRAWFSKGTDPGAKHARERDVFVVEPTDENGLSKPTAFSFEFHPLKLHKVVVMDRTRRRLGRLEAAAFDAILHEFQRIVDFNRKPGRS